MSLCLSIAEENPDEKTSILLLLPTEALSLRVIWEDRVSSNKLHTQRRETNYTHSINHEQNTSVDEVAASCRETAFQSAASAQCLSNVLGPTPEEASVIDTFPAASAFSLYLSALEPITWPNTDAAIVNAIADLGIKTDFLSIPMNGTAAWTAANHAGENFLVCSLHIPNGTLAAMPSIPITRTFVGRA